MYEIQRQEKGGRGVVETRNQVHRISHTPWNRACKDDREKFIYLFIYLLHLLKFNYTDDQNKNKKKELNICTSIKREKSE